MPATPVVVVIEDHPELSDVLRDVMTERGYDVLSVRDQFAAVATLRGRHVDLVVSDLPTAEAGRPDPLAEIVRDHAEVPLIQISEMADDGVPFLGPWMRTEGRFVLRRPFKLDDLLRLSREIIAEVGVPSSPPPVR